ncbi:hypothetical protein PTTG_09933, partial [Puccinia triticina 1-1 BBBD Race 1]
MHDEGRKNGPVEERRGARQGIVSLRSSVAGFPDLTRRQRAQELQVIQRGSQIAVVRLDDEVEMFGAGEEGRIRRGDLDGPGKQLLHEGVIDGQEFEETGGGMVEDVGGEEAAGARRDAGVGDDDDQRRRGGPWTMEMLAERIHEHPPRLGVAQVRETIDSSTVGGLGPRALPVHGKESPAGPSSSSPASSSNESAGPALALMSHKPNSCGLETPTRKKKKHAH